MNTPGKAIALLWQTSSLLTRKLDQTLGTLHGLALAEYMVLDVLNHAPQQRMRRVDLAEQINRTASGVTRMLLPMEKVGLVARQTNPRDARVSLVQLTPAGARILEQATDTLNESAETLLGPLSTKQLTRLNQDLLQIL